jgi:hypothetical protein
VTESALDPRIRPLPPVIAGTCEPRVARDIRRPPRADRGLHAAARARLRVPHRDHRGGGSRASFRSRTPRHARPHTHCVAIAEAAATNIPRHSVHRRRMRGRMRRRPVLVRVGHDPAAAPDLITRRGGSRSRREVDLYYAAAEDRSTLGDERRRLGVYEEEDPVDFALQTMSIREPSAILADRAALNAFSTRVEEVRRRPLGPTLIEDRMNMLLGLSGAAHFQNRAGIWAVTHMREHWST